MTGGAANINTNNINFKNLNFHNEIGKADIKNIKLNSNGDMTLLVTDVYDFNHSKSYK